jgi:hypothetical protein
MLARPYLVLLGVVVGQSKKAAAEIGADDEFQESDHGIDCACDERTSDDDHCDEVDHSEDHCVAAQVKSESKLKAIYHILLSSA